MFDLRGAIMSIRRCVLLLPVVALLLSASGSPVFAATAKTYQVTGPVLELTDSMIVVQKGQQRWEILRDASTKVTGELKVGAKVTIEYRMTATSVEAKAAPAAKAKKK
jgi:hypothetical protein